MAPCSRTSRRTARRTRFHLNSLDLSASNGLATGEDYTRRDLFYRFNQTFQEYFDISAQMDTTYA